MKIRNIIYTVLGKDTIVELHYSTKKKSFFLKGVILDKLPQIPEYWHRSSISSDAYLVGSTEDELLLRFQKSIDLYVTMHQNKRKVIVYTLQYSSDASKSETGAWGHDVIGMGACFMKFGFRVLIECSVGGKSPIYEDLEGNVVTDFTRHNTVVVDYAEEKEKFFATIRDKVSDLIDQVDQNCKYLNDPSRRPQ